MIARHAELLSVEWLREHGVLIAVVVGLAVLVTFVAHILVRRMRRRMEGAVGVTQQIALGRATTVTSVISNALRIVIWTIAILLVLGQLGLNLAPLLAGAGVAGVALGFGAQSLVRDFLSGFFILVEQQFTVGQIVELATPTQAITGKVEAVSMRATWLRSFDGTLYVVPNGNIQAVGNRSQGWGRAIVDVGVAKGEDLERVRGILDELLEELREDDASSGTFFSGPELLGVERFSEYEIVMRVVAETRPSKRIDVERDLRARIKQRFDQRGVQMPVPPVSLPRAARAKGS